MDLGKARRTKMMPPLPHELVMQILSWIPAENVWALRYINKTWFGSIARDPKFAKLHFDRCIQLKRNPSILARSLSDYYVHTTFLLAKEYTACDKAIQLEPPFYRQDQDQDPTVYTVYGICNGLLCLSNNRNDEVYIWNPTIHHHITIPCSQFTGVEGHTEFAFGFHQGTNQYKVIKSKYMQSSNCSQVSVYTLGVDSSWRTVGGDIQYEISSTYHPWPVVNGGVHWLARRTGASTLRVIIAFDLKAEFVQEIPTPDDVNFGEGSRSHFLTEFGGQLCVLRVHGQQHVQIWAMQEYGLIHSWTKLYKFRLPQVGGVVDVMEPVGVVAHNGDIIVNKNFAELFLYHPNTNSISFLPNFPFHDYDACSYIGSIISPRLISGVGHIKT